jgi:hypothetical protein
MSYQLSLQAGAQAKPDWASCPGRSDAAADHLKKSNIDIANRKDNTMNSTPQLNMIAKLDLDPIKVKLMHKQSGEGWSLEQANAMAFEYRRFLCLMKLFPHEQVAPLFEVDIFWHYHILDTMKYADDCQQIFGYFLHHFPYSGLRGEDDAAFHQQLGARMQALYETTFGEAYLRQDGRHATTARSNPATTKMAFSQPATAMTAFSQPALPHAAFSQPAMTMTAWTKGTTSNNHLYSRPVLATHA